MRSTQVKAKGGRKISFPEFQQACEHLATKKVCRALVTFRPLPSTATTRPPHLAFAQGIPVKDLEHKILQAGGPKTQATKADYVKFHDDKVLALTASHITSVPTTTKAIMSDWLGSIWVASLTRQMSRPSSPAETLCGLQPAAPVIQHLPNADAEPAAVHLHRSVCGWRTHQCGRVCAQRPCLHICQPSLGRSSFAGVSAAACRFRKALEMDLT